MNPQARDGDDIRVRLGQALRVAIAARDLVAVSALRTALSAIGNAEAVPPGPAAAAAATSPHFAGATAGLGAGDAPRRELSATDLVRIVRAEITERQDAAREYERSGRPDRSERLAREAGVLLAVLAEADPAG